MLRQPDERRRDCDVPRHYIDFSFHFQFQFICVLRRACLARRGHSAASVRACLARAAIFLKLHAGMNNAGATERQWNERGNEPMPPFPGAEPMFQLLFERSTDPIWLFDPKSGVFVDCNAAAVELLGYRAKRELLLARPEDLSPPQQPDGRSSKDAAAELTARVEREGGLRFEWLARRASGEEVPLEVVATPITSGG